MEYIINKQKEIAKEVLQKLQHIDPDVMVAGGAVSDWARDVPARDLDVYINIPKGEYYSHVENDLYMEKHILPLITGYNRILKSDYLSMNKLGSKQYYQGVNGIKDVYKIQYKDIDIEIIVCSTPTNKMIRNFDADICMASMTNKQTTVTPECEDAFKRKKITLTRNERTTDELFERRLKKLKKKYVGYTIEIVSSRSFLDDIPF